MTFQIEPNTYNEDAPPLSKKGLEALSPASPILKSNLTFEGSVTTMNSGEIRSKNYKAGVSGWILKGNGDVEFN